MSVHMETAVHLGTWPVGSEEWLAARRNGLGGSEIAAVLGLSPWESKLSLWHRKRGELPEPDLSGAMDAGTRLEPTILQWFADMHPEFEVASSKATFAHRDRPWQVANLDGECLIDGAPATGVECKYSLYGDGFGPAGSSEIPLRYLCQVLHYIDVMDWPGMWVAVFIGAQGEFRDYWIDADPNEQEFMREQGRLFVESLTHADQRPEIDLHIASFRAVRQMHPDIDPTIAVALDETLALDWHIKKAALKAAEAEERQANARVLHALGNARRGIVAGRNTVIRVPSTGGGAPHLRTSRTRKKAA